MIVLSREVGLPNALYRRLQWWLQGRTGSKNVSLTLANSQTIALPRGNMFAVDLFCLQRSIDWGSEGLLIRYLKTIPEGCFIASWKNPCASPGMS